MSAQPRTDAKAIRVSTLEGKPVYGGELLVKLRQRGEQMIMLEIFYAAGVGTEATVERQHQHAGRFLDVLTLGSCVAQRGVRLRRLFEDPLLLPRGVGGSIRVTFPE